MNWPGRFEFSARPVIGSAGTAFDSAAALMRDRVPAIVDQLSRTAAALDAAVKDIAARSAATLGGFTQTADLLNTRLAELEQSNEHLEKSVAAYQDERDQYASALDEIRRDVAAGASKSSSRDR